MRLQPTSTFREIRQSRGDEEEDEGEHILDYNFNTCGTGRTFSLAQYSVYIFGGSRLTPSHPGVISCSVSGNSLIFFGTSGRPIMFGDVKLMVVAICYLY